MKLFLAYREGTEMYIAVPNSHMPLKNTIIKDVFGGKCSWHEVIKPSKMSITEGIENTRELFPTLFSTDQN